MPETQSDIIKIIEKFIIKVNAAGIKIEKTFLYGSFAGGNPKIDSDIDVALISSGFSDDFVENYVRLAKIRSNIDCRIEPKAFRPGEFVDEHPLVWEIKQHGIPITNPKM